LYPALSTVIVEAGNVAIGQFGTFNDVNKSINRSFEFNTAIPAFNVSLFTPGQFSLKTIEVNQTDNVTINFYNIKPQMGTDTLLRSITQIRLIQSLRLDETEL
jgi:hypothetical protein